MTAFLFGTTPDSWASTADGRPIRGARVTFYTAMTGGSPVTVTLTDNTTATTLTTDATGFWPQFYGPDQVVVLWASVNGGPRLALISPDGILAGSSGGTPVADASTTVKGLARFGTTAEQAAGTSTAVASNPAGVQAAINAAIASLNIPAQAQSVQWVQQNSDGSWPARPTSDGGVLVYWRGIPSGAAPTEATSGTGGMRTNVDIWVRVPA